MRKFIAFVFVLSVSAPAFSLNLQEALTHGYNNNDDLKIIRTEFLNDIEQFSQAFSGFMPTVNLNISRSSEKQKYPGRPGTSSNEIVQQRRTLEVVQPLFNGGSTVAALKSAQYAFRASRGSYYVKEQKTLLDLIENYLDYFESQEKLSIAESRLRTNVQQVKTIEEKLKLGEATEIDRATARAALAAAETNQLASYATFQARKASFIRVFGIEPVAISIPKVPENLPNSLSELEARSLALNPSIDATRHNVHATKAVEMVEKGKLLPQMQFSLQTGSIYYDQSPAANNSKNVNTVLSVKIPIYPDGGAQYSNIRRAKNKTRLYAIQLDSVVKQIRAYAVSSWEEYMTSKSRITASEQGIQSAQISYDGIAQEEIVGSKTVLDVLSAEEKLYEAKISRVEAYKAAILAAYKMKSLTGELTAKSLKLKVKYFSPEDEFKNLKKKLIIGF